MRRRELAGRFRWHAYRAIPTCGKGPAAHLVEQSAMGEFRRSPLCRPCWGKRWSSGFGGAGRTAPRGTPWGSYALTGRGRSARPADLHARTGDSGRHRGSTHLRLLPVQPSAGDEPCEQTHTERPCGRRRAVPILSLCPAARLSISRSESFRSFRRLNERHPFE